MEETNLPGGVLRRSSSLQLPGPSERNVQLHSHQRNLNFNFIHSAICTLKSSSASIYASTLSAAGLLGGVGLGGLRPRSSISSTEPVNLYSVMVTYRCCCGMFRLRMASMLVGVLICVSSTLILCSLLLNAPISPTAFFAPWQCQIIGRPAILLSFVSLLASLLLLLGLATDIHFLLLPFLLSCIFNMMGSMALGLVLLLNPLAVYLPSIRHFGSLAELIPAGMALCSSAMVVLHLWFLVLGAFTYVLIRDKRSLFIEYFNDECMDDEDGLIKLVIRRSSSAPLNRVNSAEF
ncbi:hypothetical protein GPALN_014580 [Globodera pallida]|nr:hypothetical protein GPALN_014580 [Globodera pallida]